MQDPQQPDANAEIHSVHFYEPSQFPAKPIASFLDSGLTQGEAAILIATLDHSAQVQAKMEESGWNCEDLREVGLLEVTDMDEMLRAFQAGTPIVTIVEKLIEATIRPAQQKSPSKRIRIYGDSRTRFCQPLGKCRSGIDCGALRKSPGIGRRGENLLRLFNECISRRELRATVHQVVPSCTIGFITA